MSLPASMDPDDVIPIKSDAGLLSTAIDRESGTDTPTSTKAQYATSNLRRAHTVAQAGNGIRRNMEARAARETAATSLLRAKDSQELLRKRSMTQVNTQLVQPAHPVLRDIRAGLKETSHFTVGNVGQNGKIFLRPIRNPSQSEQLHPFPPFVSSATRPGGQGQHVQLGQAQVPNESARWSSSQLSELGPQPRPEEENIVQDADSAVVDSTVSEHTPSRRPRAHSFTTLSEHQSVAGSRHPGEFRIVIDRSEDRPKTTDGPHRPPTLEIPIPRVRLGTSQFTTEGSAALHTSVYTRTSLSDNFRASRFLRENSPIPNVYLDPAQANRPSFHAPMLSPTLPMELNRASAVTDSPVVYELKEPIEPSLFEDLVSDMDNASVVRYIPGTKDISAATPARIVAQISSESFMDYELVSDFFLTFRSYLSANNLLALLLARLQWAINRLQDDGRIIRIRTFAALRHWILNYFVDDFVVDYDLRAYFCETINAMYDNVKARKTGGLSDLKILIDLKRCWQGKSSQYWDFLDLCSAYQNPDNPIVPGDVRSIIGVDSDSSRGHYQSVVRADLPPSAGRGAHRILSGEKGRFPVVQHDRSGSSATAKSLPNSTRSEQSAHITSCSLPPRSPRRLSAPLRNGKAAHPVPRIPTKFAPAPQEPASVSPISKRLPYHSHKRSGSFSDSVRDDRAPLSLLDQMAFSTPPDVESPGSLIRGTLYPPVESFMTMMAPPSPPLPSSSSVAPLDRRNTTSDATHKPTPSHSGVKTIIGSIRRALHSRSAGQSISERTGRRPSGSSLRGKTSAVPINVAFGSDLYRDRKTPATSKRPARIDTLCDEVLRQYRRVLADYGGSRNEAPQAAVISKFQATLQGPPRDTEYPPRQPLVPEQTGAKSRMTMGSESIVIVDDTGFDFPIMSGAVMERQPSKGSEQNAGFSDSQLSPVTPKAFAPVPSHKSRADDEYSLRIYYDDAGSGPPKRISRFLHHSGISAARRSYSAERGSTFLGRTSPSLRLRKYASFQSGISRHRRTMGSESMPPPPDLSVSQDTPEKSVGPSLRRRPGGDLRRMQNGGFPRSYAGSSSFRSHHSYTSSMLDSTSSRLRDQISRPQTLVLPNPRFSLMQTNSNQNIRRSFEAAIARFAQIPDDDDGGIESTLLKLEGKWSPPSGNSPRDATFTETRCQDPRHEGERWFQPHHPALGPSNIPGSEVLLRRRQTLLGDNMTYSQARGRLLPPRPYSDSVAESDESYSSIPLLERGLSDDSMKAPMLNTITSAPVMPRTEVRELGSRDPSEVESSHPSFDVVKKTESIQRIPRGSTHPVPTPRVSRDQKNRMSELSSNLSVDVIEARDAMDQRYSIGTSSLASSAVEIPPHPLAHPPSPPMTIQNPRSVTSWTTPLNTIPFQPQPLTPDPSPRHRNAGHDDAQRSIDMQNVSDDVLWRSEMDRQRYQPSKEPDAQHVPFILSCESQVLAQQLTLVEMAALSEVDWKDLVDMRWSSGSPSMLNWVQFLTEEEHRGIDLVVGRFNLMVKWVLSEIVLTQDIHERALTISKFIHTAAHAKRICNYATMLQIAIALSSTDCSRLQKTWALVSRDDRRVLKDMECLIQPVRNFHDLRTEMETANLQEGCIPFVGLYVHDLTYNAQKPAQISNPNGEPLINFERYRTAARIIKSLLRLIDASTKYNFQPVQGIIERCLWIASLSEQQIQSRSKALE